MLVAFGGLLGGAGRAQETPADRHEPFPTADMSIPDDRARATPLFIAYFENDWFGGTDWHYTNGLKLAWLTPDLTGWGKTGWRQRTLEALPFINRAGSQKNLGIGVGQQIYTPRDVTRTVPDPLDRPYAGWSYLEFSFLAKTEHQADTIAVQLGMIGPHSYAEDAQIFIHDLVDDEAPRGWAYQLHDEFGVNVAWERKWRVCLRPFGDERPPSPHAAHPAHGRQTWGLDLLPHFGAVAGNVSTYANVGATLRLGYNLPSDFGVALMRPAGLATAPVDDFDPRVRGDEWSCFIFGGFDGRAIARDIFLDGNTFRDSRRVEKRPFVADFTCGFGIIRGCFQLTFTRVRRTQEFETQVGNDSDFGSVTGSWTF